MYGEIKSYFDKRKRGFESGGGGRYHSIGKVRMAELGLVEIPLTV